MKMKLGEILRRRQSVAWAYALKVKSGGMAMRLRKAINPVMAEIREHDEYVQQMVKDTGKTGVDPGDPEYDGIMRRAEEALEVEVEYEIAAPLALDDFAEIECSAADLDALVTLGIIKE